jgi:SAM-dependent methyltransferase
MPDYAALHTPHAALLRAALEAASPQGARVALDLGCANGDKTPWLAACAAPDALVLGLDHDPMALRGACLGARICADAHALPLRPATLDLIWCVAVLGLLADPPRALAEAAAALRPGGALVVAAAGERWVRRRAWPSGEPAPDLPLPPPADGLGAELGEALEAAGLHPVALHAYLLDPPGLTPTAALLPLVGLPGVTPLELGEPEPLAVLLLAVGRRR